MKTASRPATKPSSAVKKDKKPKVDPAKVFGTPEWRAKYTNKKRGKKK